MYTKRKPKSIKATTHNIFILISVQNKKIGISHESKSLG